MKNCIFCSKEFEPKSITHSHCSKECLKAKNLERLEIYKKLHRQTIAKRSCIVCSIIFLPNHPHIKICSLECKQKKASSSTPNLSFRFELLKKFNFTCQYCGQKAPEVILHIDHVLPRAKGGKDDIDNLTVACKDCNLGKSDTLLNI